MQKKFQIAAIALGALTLTACGEDSGAGGMREGIRAVGSSTVYPFARIVSEEFTRAHPEFPAPVIESTGTGGGINLFCQGTGANTPDIANASRRMELSEFEDCQANDVEDITEIQVGMDGIAVAAAQGGINMNLTTEIIYRALAANPYGEEQTATTWSDVDPSLPDLPILVYGPPSTSGTRDSFEELILMEGCDANPEMATLKEQDEDRHDQVCTEIRNDGAYVDQGEQDNLIVQKIESNPRAVGVFGYSYLDDNSDRIQGMSINGVEPTYENVASSQYPGAREMFIYVKNAHVGSIPGLQEFLESWAASWQEDGPLAQAGLVTNADDVMARMTSRVQERPTLTAADFE